MIGILTEHEAGAKCADLCRKHGMSEGTFYVWKAKFGGMTVPDVAAYDAVYKRMIERLDFLHVNSMISMEELKFSTAIPTKYL